MDNGSELSEASDTDKFELVQNRKRKKQNTLTNKGTDPPSLSLAYRVKLQKSVVPIAKAKISMTGNSSATSSILKASKTTFVKKAVFCLNNIDSEYSENDVLSYIKSLGVNILTCFELKSTAKTPIDRKAFRICIAEDDKPKLLDNSVWAVGITIRDWIRKGDRVVGKSNATDQPGASLGMDYCDSDIFASDNLNPRLNNSGPNSGPTGALRDGPTSDSATVVNSNVENVIFA